jgi:hypothetical protein
MSTPVAKATEIKLRGDWDQTPVIIKTGGGTVDPPEVKDPPLRIPITIDAQDQDFESHLLDDRWGSAKSVQDAKILKVTVADGDNVLPSIDANVPGLAVVQITLGAETLIVQEVAQPDSQYTKLTITSSHLFAAVGGEDKWSESKAEVPADPPFVVFTQGERTETIRCTSNEVQITLLVDWGTM